MKSNNDNNGVNGRCRVPVDFHAHSIFVRCASGVECEMNLKMCLPPVSFPCAVHILYLWQSLKCGIIVEMYSYLKTTGDED